MPVSSDNGGSWGRNDAPHGLENERENDFARLERLLTIRDVMKHPVDAEAVNSVEGLRLTHDEGPRALLVDLRLVVLVLQRGEHDHPEAVEEDRYIVVLDKAVDAVIVELQSDLKQRKVRSEAWFAINCARE